MILPPGGDEEHCSQALLAILLTGEKAGVFQELFVPNSRNSGSGKILSGTREWK